MRYHIGFLRIGKQKAWKLLKMKSDLRECSAVFLNSPSGKADIATAGEKFGVALYGDSETDSLDQLRVVCYNQTVASFDLVSLPPTSAACDL